MKDALVGMFIVIAALLMSGLVVLFIIGVMGLLMAIFPFIAWHLWNSLAPIFWHSAPHLTFWQTFGIMFLIGIVFGGVRFGGK